MRLARPLAAGLAAVLVHAGGGTAYAQDNTAVAINTKDGFDIFRLAFSINRVATDVVDNGNAAVAYASCTDCQTIALAIQVVLVLSDPSVVTPENLALAVNVQCNLCDTLASAYQFVLTTGGPVRFTAEGQQRLAAIRRALLALRDSGLTVFEVQRRVDALMDELADLLADELVSAGSSGTTGPEQPPPSPSPPPAGSASPSPVASETPASSPSASESPEPSGSPSPEPTP